MNCHDARNQIGPHLDGELTPEAAAALEKHLAACPACRAEYEAEASTAAAIRGTDSAADVRAPGELWQAIQSRLASERAVTRADTRPAWFIRLLHRPAAVAASVAVLLGVGVFTAVLLNPAAQVAQAGSIDYSILLNGVSSDVDAAVERFLKHYRGERLTPAEITAVAAPLRFSLPPELPGGFRLEGSYRLQFGEMTGFAAQYRRDGEPLFVFFHPPVGRTVLGVHRESQCHVAGRGGQCVEIGPWQLIHFTDATTCHCLLSRLTNPDELHAVLAAVSPDFTTTQPAHHH